MSSLQRGVVDPYLPHDQQQVAYASFDYWFEVQANPLLSSSSKVLYSLLFRLSLTHGTRMVSMPAAETARALNCSAQHVTKLVNELRNNGIIETRYQGGGRPLLFVISGYLDSAPQMPLLPEIPEIRVGKKANVTHVDFGKTPGLSDESLPPDPLPAREYYIAPTPRPENAGDVAPLTDDAMVLVQKLTQHGVTASVARDLVRRLPARCAQQLEYFPFAGHKASPGGYLRMAIEADYAPPKRFLEANRRREAERAEIAKRDPVADRQVQLRAEIANRELLETLPEAVRYQLELQVDEQLTKFPWNRATRETKMAVRAGMILEAAKNARFGDQVSA